jgi:copper chaperone CopZ
MNVSYLHVMDGRVRVKVPEMKRSASKALHVEEVIKSLEGITRVWPNPTTGNVLVYFDSAKLTHTDILLALKRAGYLREENSAPSFQVSERVVDTVSNAVARSIADVLMQRAMERAIVALL